MGTLGDTPGEEAVARNHASTEAVAWIAELDECIRMGPLQWAKLHDAVTDLFIELNEAKEASK
jgi:hypothetical protein